MTTPINPKDIEHAFNANKKNLLDKTLNFALESTKKFVEKTNNQDKDSSVQMAQSGIKLVEEKNKVNALPGSQLPDLHIKGGSEPTVKITYPNLMNRVFYQGAPIQLVFDTENVKKPYYCFVYANTNGVLTRLFVSPRPIRFDHHEIPNILINRQLPIGKHDIFVAIYDGDNNGRRKLLNSKGEEVIASTRQILGIEIRAPVATGTITPGTTGKPTTPGTPEAKKEEEKGIKGLLKPHTPSPEIKITNKGDFGKTFAGADLVPLVFEVKNIAKYNASIFLQKDSNNAIELGTKTYDKPIIKLSLPIRDLIRKKDPSLNLSDYKKLLVLLRDEHGNQLSGTKLIDSVDIKINPLMLTAGGPAAVAVRAPIVEVNLPDDLTNDKEQRVVFTVKNIDDTSGRIDYDYEITVGDPYGGKPMMKSSGKHTTITPFADPNIDLSKVKVFYTSGIGGPMPLPTRITITIIDNLTKRKITAYKDVRIGEKKGTIF